MQKRSFAVMRLYLSSLAISGAVLIACFGFCGTGTAPASEMRGELRELISTHGATYYVATNGSDEAPGLADRPWATVNYAAEKAKAGDTVVVRGGHYMLAAQVRVRNSGRPGAWITYVGYPGEEPILDAQLVKRPSSAPVGFNNGAFQIQSVSYIRVANLSIINSHDAGFTIRDSSDIDLINNTTNGTFSSGIAVWDTNHKGKSTQHIRIIGNIVSNATTWDQAPPELPRQGSAPQEALSIAGAVYFEVAYNDVHDSGTAGIDIKETSKHGEVHHNLIHNVLFGMYVDAWFGEIRNIEIFSNIVHDCQTAGLGMSVESGTAVEGVEIHNNLVFNNGGSGFYFSRWGVNNIRRNIQIYKNTFFHNGYAAPSAGQTYFWMTGGLYIYSTNVRDIRVADNIFSDNRGFQIGYSELFMTKNRSWQTVSREKNIKITGNLIYGQNLAAPPVQSGGDPPDRVKIYATNGDRAIFGNPLFKDPANQEFTLRQNSPAMVGGIAVGAYPQTAPSQDWWKRGFPPRLIRSRFDPSNGKR